MPTSKDCAPRENGTGITHCTHVSRVTCLINGPKSCQHFSVYEIKTSPKQASNVAATILMTDVRGRPAMKSRFLGGGDN